MLVPIRLVPGICSAGRSRERPPPCRRTRPTAQETGRRWKSGRLRPNSESDAHHDELRAGVCGGFAQVWGGFDKQWAGSTNAVLPSANSDRCTAIMLEGFRHGFGGFGQVRSRPNLGALLVPRRIRPIGAKSGADVADAEPSLGDFGRTRFEHLEVGHKLDLFRPTLGRRWPTLDRVRPNLGRCRSNLVRFGQIWAESCQHWADVGR